MKTFKNFIGGDWVPPVGGEYFENTNPADLSDMIGRFPLSGAADVERAVASAQRGFEIWRATPAPARGDVLRRIGDVMVKRKEEIADLMTREMGKPLTETRGDVQEGIDTAYYAAVEGRRLFGHTVPSEMKNKWAMSFRRPIGVAGIITPFNFPMAIPTWKMFPALLCGNACIFKPAEDVPETGHVLVEIMLEAGLPPEVIQLVHGLGESAGAAIVNHPLIPVISFTGSTETGRIVGEVCGRMHKRLSLEMGGKNAQIVFDDADLDLALEGVLWGAFGTTGQRCTATSRLVLQDGIHDELLSRLIDRARELKLGDGRKKGTDVGPMINLNAVEKAERYVDIGQGENAELMCGGRRPTGKNVENGYFFEPTIFARVRPGMRLEQEEIFGPVLSVLRFRTTDEAFAINNDVKYGLSSSVYTKDVNVSMRAMNELDNGITYINAPTIGAEAHLPFGGVKQTGNGHREGGWEVYEFYSETKVGYIDFSGALQRAQIDNYLGRRTKAVERWNRFTLPPFFPARYSSHKMSLDDSTPLSPDDQPADASARGITPAQRMDALRELNRGRSGFSFLWEWAKILLVSIGLFGVIRTFLVEAFKIPSGSMENTLQVGDFLLVNKLVYGAEVPFTHTRLPRIREPKRGDVIVFEWPEDRTKNFVKRLVGVPGDTVEMREGTLIRNGAAIKEGYIEHTEPDMDPAPEDFRWQREFVPRTSAAAIGYHPSRNNWGPLVVPKGNYFVLGDNRDNSLDSRYWGFVPDSLVKGRPFVIYYSYAPDTVDTFAWLTHIRWTRLGERIK